MAPHKKRKNSSRAGLGSSLEENNGTQPPKKRKSAPKVTSIISRRHTRGMTTDAARKAVFNTSELLESILVYLPPKTLFGVQRVSKQFQAIIATSVPIQEKMFLRLRNTPGRGWLNKQKITPGKADRYFVESTDQSPQKALRIPTQLNPFLGLRSKDLSCAERTNWRNELATLKLKQPISLVTLEHRTSSILNTYISDPPSNHVQVYSNYEVPKGEVEVWRTMRDGERGDGTIGDSIRNMLEGDGRALLWDHKGNSCSPNIKEHPDGGLASSRQIIKGSEDASGLNDRRKERGFRKVELTIYDMVVPTEAERAAVKSRAVEE